MKSHHAATLTFRNRALNRFVPDVVLFQQNTAPHRELPPVAWRLIKSCSYYQFRQILFNDCLYMNSNDWNNIYTQMIPVVEGDFFKVVENPCGGYFLYRCDLSYHPREITVLNGLTRGAVDINIYRSNRLLGKWPSVIPGQCASFKYDKTISIATAFRVKEEMPLREQNLNGTVVPLDLRGISEADIVMTGGGCGPDALPFSFHMENINKYDY